MAKTARKKASKKPADRSSMFDRLKGQAAKAATGQFWKPPKGNSVIRVLEFEHNGELEVFVEEVQHYGVLPGGRRPVTCSGPGCPICELKAQIDDKDWKDISPSIRYTCNAVVRDPRRNSDKDKLVIAQISKTLFTKAVAVITDEDYADEYPLDLIKGRDFKISRTGEREGTTYDLLPAPRATPVGGDYQVVDLMARQPEPTPMDVMQAHADTYMESR